MDIVEKQKRDYFRRQFCFHLERYKKAGKTQNEFCIEAGVNKNSVTGWKQGKSYPHDAKLIKICEVLGIDQRALTTQPPDEQHFIDKMDILDLLKGRKKVRMLIEGGGSSWWYVCEECQTAVDKKDKFCRQCGGEFV